MKEGVGRGSKTSCPCLMKTPDFLEGIRPCAVSHRLTFEELRGEGRDDREPRGELKGSLPQLNPRCGAHYLKLIDVGIDVIYEPNSEKCMKSLTGRWRHREREREGIKREKNSRCMNVHPYISTYNISFKSQLIWKSSDFRSFGLACRRSRNDIFYDTWPHELSIEKNGVNPLPAAAEDDALVRCCSFNWMQCIQNVAIFSAVHSVIRKHHSSDHLALYTDRNGHSRRDKEHRNWAIGWFTEWRRRRRLLPCIQLP